MQDKAPPTLLVVDDELPTCNAVKNLGESLGFMVVTAIDGRDAWNKLDENPDIDAVITDVRMPNIDGLMVLQHIYRLDRQPKTLIHSGDKVFYRDGERYDLTEHVPTYFGEFACFALKSNDLAEQRTFLEQVLAARQ